MFSDLINFARTVLGGLDNVPHALATKLGEETTTCVKFHQQLISYFLDGKVAGIWCHIPNEGKMSKAYGYTQKKMGKIPGMPDYVFMWKDGSACIEFKSKTGKLTDNQKQVEAWCKRLDVPYYVCRSYEEGINTLKAIGFILAAKADQ